MTYTPIRVFFSKTGRAKYISHLDTMRTLTRALRRSGLPLWHTQGFNPHLYLTFALPLPLGCEGLRESFDVRLEAEMDFTQVADAISQVVPPGFQVLAVTPQVMEPGAIAWADYRVRLRYPHLPESPLEALGRFQALPEILVIKKTKKGEKEMDIAPHSQVLTTEMVGEELSMTLRMAAGIHLNIKPDLYLEAFAAWWGHNPDGTRLTRCELLTDKIEAFC